MLEYPVYQWPDLVTTEHPSMASHGHHTPLVMCVLLVSSLFVFYSINKTSEGYTVVA